MQPRVIGRAAGLAVLIGSVAAPVVAASNDSVEAQIQALRQIVEHQQTQLDAQKQQLETQRAEIDALRGRTSRAGARTCDRRRRCGPRANRRPRAVGGPGESRCTGSPRRAHDRQSTCGHERGRTGLARGPRQRAAGHGSLRPGSGGAPGQRLSSRIGRRGRLARDRRRARPQRRCVFPARAYRRRGQSSPGISPIASSLSSVAPGRKGPRASMMPTLPTPVSHRSPSSSARSRRPPTSPTAPRRTTCCSSNVRRPRSCHARWAAPTAGSASACASAGRGGSGR